MDPMDQKLLRQREAKCIQENPPGCTARCPVHVDVKGLVEAIGKKEYAKGFALLNRVVPFPGILSRICDQPCQQACKRNEIDEAIFIRALEQVCVDQNATAVGITTLPIKEKKAAVVGAGLSGLTVAVELARKGYPVEVFEATERLGGRIWSFSDQELPRQLIQDDFSTLGKLPIEIHYHTTVTSVEHLVEAFDAVYLGTGAQHVWCQDSHVKQDADGNIQVDELTLATIRGKIFAGGSLRTGKNHYSAIASVADGKMAAISIDRLFQGASLSANRDKEGSFETSLYTNIQGLAPEPQVRPTAQDGSYTVEEGVREANRCLLCECLECVKVCEYLAHYRSYPKRYVREIYNNLSIVMGIHRANKLINSCSLCGLCAKVCPGNLNMGEICLEARRMMVDKGKMPPSTHDFVLRDMQFSNSERCALSKHQPGRVSSKYVFFSGCQLAASAPQHVKKTYDFLCEKLLGGVGLMLGCCGAPANWAGQKTLCQETLRTIEMKWEQLGNPCIITACPSCQAVFKENLPHIPMESLWVMLEQTGLPEGAKSIHTPKKLAVHDSCTARQEYQMQNSVRSIANQLGYQVEELPFNRENTTCCSYGGLLFHANREIAHKVIQRRIEESNSDYLAYCIMCRDNFVNQGKRVYHLLDIIFKTGDAGVADQKGPGYSQRQENREKLKTSLLQDVWGESMEQPRGNVKVIIPDHVRCIMEDRMILVDDVVKVIAHAQDSGKQLKNADTGCYIAYLQLGNVTYWVEYFPENDAFLVQNSYCHRINITD